MQDDAARDDDAVRDDDARTTTTDGHDADTGSLTGRSALVAGATGGLGRAITAGLAARGATVTAVGRDAERLGGLDAARTATLDLRAPEACASAVEAAIETGGSLDIVVNAVGVVAFGPVAELSIDTMEELFLTNTFVPIMLAKAALPAMAEGGVIVNLSGVIAERNLPGMAAYGASKAAVRSFDEALAREARRSKVRVLDARPPHTDTGLADHPLEGEAPRLGDGLDPAEVAGVICDAIADGSTTDLPGSAFGQR
ncbi:MAG: SDR family oxidoreductase [Actinomycetota bacterium]|nr:SDR family oxidoreductase [Actinomycetota bacterium]